jgi:1-acyl-sn-glycerol-3-phosphate acyltransferase
MRDYGYLPVAFCLLGTFLLVIRGDKKSYSLVLGLVVMLLVLVTYYTFHYGMQPLYTRGLMYMMLMMSVVAGAGLNGIRKLKIPEKISRQLRVPSLVTQNMGAILCFVLVGIVLAQAIPSHQRIPYYHMIDGQDYEVFVWIKDNVAEKYDRAILDPWKATAFTAITRKHVYTRIHEFAKPSDDEAYEFLSDNCTDTAFLRENGISIVYTGDECKNPSLIKVRQNVYLLEE